MYARKNIDYCEQALADLLSLIPMTSRGPPQIVIFDIHALQERFYFSNTVIPRSELHWCQISSTLFDFSTEFQSNVNAK